MNEVFAINWESVWKILRGILFFVLLYLTINWTIKICEKKIIKHAKDKKEKSNIQIFFQVLRYLLVGLALIFAILSYTGSIAGIGITAGLLSAALGWALQRPITGIAGWLMVVIKRPFEIGDRVIIGKVKGDIIDITLTHIHIREIGGTIPSEETSGRIILIPNAKLFEVDIINYTQQDEYILDQIKFAVTFESNLEKVKKIVLASARSFSGVKNPYVRSWFQPSGMDVVLRYYTLASKREEVSSKVSQKILEKIKKEKEIELAYPHQEIILSKKKEENSQGS